MIRHQRWNIRHAHRWMNEISCWWINWVIRSEINRIIGRMRMTISDLISLKIRINCWHVELLLNRLICSSSIGKHQWNHWNVRWITNHWWKLFLNTKHDKSIWTRTISIAKRTNAYFIFIFRFECVVRLTHRCDTVGWFVWSKEINETQWKWKRCRSRSRRKEKKTNE